jgi:serine/threonine-protein kinase
MFSQPTDHDDPRHAPRRTDHDRTEVAGNAAANARGAPSTGNGDFVLDPRAADLTVLPEFAERYHAEGEVARGGGGAILKGRDHHLHRDIAIKVVLGIHQHNPEVQRRFLQEARITSRLQHPGIVQLYDLGRFADGSPFFTMSLEKGHTLAALLEHRERPGEELPRFLKIFESICHTIAYAHHEGVIHRDLKPMNVLVAPFGVVKVMDWGIAKVLGEANLDEPAEAQPDSLPDADRTRCDWGLADTQMGTVLGTPAYMPPEQARGEIDRIDYRADVFGLGGILCEILTGEPPYVGACGNEIYRKAADADLTEASERLNACRAPADLVSLAFRCLAADRCLRPANGGAVAREITAHLESAMRRAEQDLVQFFDLCLDLFCIAGLDGFFRRVNPNFTRVLGYSTEELLSRPFLAFLHPEDWEPTIAVMARLIQGLPVSRFRNRYRDIHGNYHCFEWTAKPDTQEEVIYAVARLVADEPQPN